MHVMIDIESLGTKPGAVVASIGAVVFQPTYREPIGRSFSSTIDIADAQKRGLTIDADTLAWWMHQSEQARASTFRGEWHLDEALAHLIAFVDEARAFSTDGDLRIWAHSQSFDLALLEAAFAVIDRRAPWNFREPRDTRTLFDLAGLDFKAFPAEPGEVEHDALSDARHQVRAVIEAYRLLGKAA